MLSHNSSTNCNRSARLSSKTCGKGVVLILISGKWCVSRTIKRSKAADQSYRASFAPQHGSHSEITRNIVPALMSLVATWHIYRVAR